MTNRTIDPTRQGIAHEPEADGDVPIAPPVSVEQAMAAVAGWEASAGPKWGLHQIAIALRDEVVRLRDRESLYAEVARLESDARAMPPRHRRRNALNTEADAVRALADLFHD